MKALLINGSPHKNGCTYTALSHVAKSLESEGIEAEITWIGNQPVRGCTSCGTCFREKTKRCVFNDDIVNQLLEKVEDIDALVVGSPVYYAGANGALLATLDRMFYAGGSLMHFKPAAGVSSARRAGTTLAIDQINKYFQINKMPVVSSNYWPMVHGSKAEDVLKDEEGLQIMRVLGQNMAWLLNCIKAGEEAGFNKPETEHKIVTNFIR